MCFAVLYFIALRCCFCVARVAQKCESTKLVIQRMTGELFVEAFGRSPISLSRSALCPWSANAMLPAVDNGAGRWKEGFGYDVFHPNAAGHHAIFRGLLMSLATVFAPEQIEAQRRVLTMGRRRASALTVSHRRYMMLTQFAPTNIPDGQYVTFKGSHA